VRGALLVCVLAARGVLAEPNRLEEVVVTADRVEQPLRDVPASVTVVDRDEIERSAALTVDDLLRRVPGFSLFRRSSSLVANPTTQGVSLRGLGASGASRTLVLLDGVPLNDPFGGWVPWARVPVESLERVEIVRGPAAATAWGNYAMGGVVNLVTRKPETREADVAVEGGTRGTARTDVRVADRVGAVGATVAGGWLDTDGYPVVRDDRRGKIDVDAASVRGVLDGRATWAPGPVLHLHANAFTEDRGNGTPLTNNTTDALDLDAGAKWRDVRVLAYGRMQRFDSTFSSQADDRDSEKPASAQRVPSSAAGGSAVWSHAFGWNRPSAGADVAWVDGVSDEDVRFQQGRFVTRRRSGASQQTAGVWGGDAVTPLPGLRVDVGGRLDVWRSLDGFRRERTFATGEVTRDDRFPDRTETIPTGSIAARQEVTATDAIRGAVYRGFRAPTVNELVRPFRVRNDITEANPRLDPERLFGGELGTEHTADRWNADATAYWNEIDGQIANVTIGKGPGTVAPCGTVPNGGVCRQRQNLGGSRVRGVEANVAVRPFAGWTASAGYLFSDAVVTSAPADRALEGKRVPQVPRHQATAELAWEGPRGVTAAVLIRYVGRQLEDDRNTLPLGGFAAIDVFVGWRIDAHWDVFFRVENALDRTYEVGRTADGVVTTGAPLLAHGGVRARF
jgi:outer membrane cobalamin receptor